MNDRRAMSTVVRLMGQLAVALSFVEGVIVISGGLRIDHGAVHAVGLAAIALAIATVVFTLLRSKAARLSVRSAAAAVIAGAAVRAWALMPLTYSHPTPAIASLQPTNTYMLAAAYFLLFGGTLTLTMLLGGAPSSRWSALPLAAAGSVAIFAMLAFAAFGPVPAFNATFTQRDVFAAVLLALDSALLGIASFSMLRSLGTDRGAWSRVWLWAAVGALMFSMGDAIQPMLLRADAAEYVPALWGLGYAVAALGSSTVPDILRAKVNRTEAAETG